MAAKKLSKNNQSEKEKLIQYLDYEIELINTESQQPGWTKWAISGSFAALGWLLLDEFGKDDYSFVVITIWLIIASLLLDCLLHLSLVINDTDKTSSFRSRYFLTNRLMGNNRLIALMLIARYLSVMLFYFFEIKSASNLVSLSFYLLNGYLLFVWLIIFIVSYLKVPIPLNDNLVDVGFPRKVFNLILFLLGLISLIGVFSIPKALEVTIMDIRIVCLLSVAFYLFYLLVRVENNFPLRTFLINLRRELQFDRVDLDFAKEQAEIAIIGLRLSNVFQDYISNLLGLLEKFNNDVEEVGKLIDDIRRNMRGVKNTLSDEKHKKNLLLFSSIQKKTLGTKDFLKKKILPAYNQFKRRLDFIDKISDIDFKEYSKIMDTITFALENAASKSERILRKQEALDTMIKKYYSPS